MISPRLLLSLFILPLVTLSASASSLADEVLSEINLARTDPHLYAEIVSQNSRPSGDVSEAVRFLEKVRPLAPLIYSSGLSQASAMHVASQGPSGGRGHGFGWNSPFSRMDHFGQYIGMAGENISYGRRSARSIVCTLIVDQGVSSRGHRKNIFMPAFGTAGVAVGPHASYGTMCVIDFAGQFVERGRTAAVGRFRQSVE